MAEQPGEKTERKTNSEAEEHAEETGVPTGTTPEAVKEEEASGGALTNRDADESEDPPSPS